MLQQKVAILILGILERCYKKWRRWNAATKRCGVPCGIVQKRVVAKQRRIRFPVDDLGRWSLQKVAADPTHEDYSKLNRN